MRNSQRFLYAVLRAPVALIVGMAVPLQASDLDNRIESSVKSSYNFKNCLAADDIVVKASEGVVTLRGSVGTEAQKELTTECVKDVQGIKRVENEMSVKKS